MISVRLYTDGVVKELEPADISDCIGNDERLVWVDVVAPGEDELRLLEDEFSLHPLAMEDVRHRHQRPKLEHYPTHAFIVAYTAALEEVDFFLGATWLISVRQSEEPPAWSIDAARERFERNTDSRANTGFLLYVLLDSLVDAYFTATESSEDLLEDLEDRIFADEPADENEIQEELFDVRRRLLQFRRAVAPLREVVSALLRGEVAWIDRTTLTHLQDVYDHVLRASEQIDSQRELVGNAVDAHLAIISNRINAVMKRMTAWGAILLGATLIAGIYGMNFQHMPELGWSYGYPFALGLMGLLTVVGYRAFKKKDWL